MDIVKQRKSVYRQIRITNRREIIIRNRILHTKTQHLYGSITKINSIATNTNFIDIYMNNLKISCQNIFFSKHKQFDQIPNWVRMFMKGRTLPSNQTILCTQLSNFIILICPMAEASISVIFFLILL